VPGLLCQVLPLFRLPGDIRFETGKFRVCIPLATCILISILLTILLNIFRR